MTANAPSTGGVRVAGDAGPSLTAAEIAQRVGGTLRGDGAVRIRAVAPLARAGAEELSFLGKASYLPEFGATRAGAVLVAPEFADAAGPACRIIVARPPEAMLTLLPLLYAAPAAVPGVHATAVIGRGARIGESVSIGAHVVIEDGLSLIHI